MKKTRTLLWTRLLEPRVTPTSLTNTFFPPATGPQLKARFGDAVAISPSLRVVGAGDTDIAGIEDAGQAFVYDAANTLVATLSAPTPRNAGHFGSAVATGGKYVAVGEYRAGASSTDSGKVYVYDTTSSTFPSPAFTLSKNPVGSYDDFGASLAVSGKYLVVGAPKFAGGDAVYVYDLTTASNTPVFTLGDPTPSDNQYGSSVAISGNIVVVGDWSDDVGASDAGSAYVYDLISATPTTPIHTLNNPTPAAVDGFGISVATNGTNIVVGANFDDTSAANAGAVYKYDLSSPTPTVPTLTITAPGGSPASDVFGQSVSLAGNVLAVGTGGDVVSVYLFDLASATPSVPTLTLVHPGASSNEEFGETVAIAGNFILVGAPNVPTTFSTDPTTSGSAHVFDRTSATPATPIASLENPTDSVSEEFGHDVAASGKYLVVGAPNDSGAGFRTGVAYFYVSPSLTPVATVTHATPLENEQFGFSVAVSSNLAVVSVPNFDAGVGKIDAGQVYLYDLASATPGMPTATIANPAPANSEYFGYSVAIDGNRIVIGAPRNVVGGFIAGSVYVYDLLSATPTVPIFTIDNPSPASEDRFGDGVAISGTRIIVAAPNDDAGAANAGIAYVYDLNSGTPTTPIHTLNNPTPATNDSFGSAVAISGQLVAVGAWFDDNGVSTDVGRVYVYDLAIPTPTTPTFTLSNPQLGTDLWFGASVAISSQYVVAGFGYSSNFSSDENLAIIYDVTTGTPIQRFHCTETTGVLDRISVSLAGEVVVIGAPDVDSQNTDQGAVFTYVMGGSLSATQSGNDVTVSDTGGKSNDLKISDTGAATTVADANEKFFVIPIAATLSADGKTLHLPHSITGAITVSAAGGNDTITINPGASAYSNQFDLLGGTGTNELRVSGSPDEIVDYLDTPTSGSLQIHQGSSYRTFAYAGMDSARFDGAAAADIVFNLPTNFASSVILEDDGALGNSLSQLRALGANFLITRFSDAKSVTVNRGKAADVVTIESLPDYDGDLTVGDEFAMFASLDVVNKLKLPTGSVDLAAKAITLTSASSDVTLPAGSARFTGNSVNFVAGASVLTPTSNVLLYSDSISLDPASSISAVAAIIGTFGFGRIINLGGTDTATQLGLSDAELDTIQASMIQFSTNADITVSSTITRTAATDMNLYASGDIVFNTGAISTLGGLLNLMPTGPGAVKPLQPGFDCFAGNSVVGNRLAIAINGAAVDTQYHQYKSFGSVDLSQAQLKLSGAHVPGNGDSYTIVSATTRFGMFIGLPEAATIPFNGRTLRINYSATSATLTPIPPKVTSVVINGGAAQRSRVISATVIFDQLVDLPTNPADAFTLTRMSDNKAVTLSASVFTISGNTAVTLTFTGGATEVLDMAAAKSLADGRYSLKVLASQVNAGLFDGDGNGVGGDDHVFASAAPPNAPTNIFRLFGDSDGDADVDQLDFFAFRNAFGGPSVVFDCDQNGTVTQDDFREFRNRFGMTI